MQPRKGESREDFKQRRRIYERQYYGYKPRTRRPWHPRRNSDWNRLARTGCSYRLFHKLLESQNNRCAICGRSFGAKRGLLLPCADHYEIDGKKIVRALLCGSCNRGIGFLKDDPDVCISAAFYLSFYGHRETEREKFLRTGELPANRQDQVSASRDAVNSRQEQLFP